jgi:hypothetical protein
LVCPDREGGRHRVEAEPTDRPDVDQLVVGATEGALAR